MKYVIDFLENADHERGCALYLIRSAECTCGLGDARGEAADVEEILAEFVRVAKTLVKPAHPGKLMKAIWKVEKIARDAERLAS